MVMPNHIHGIIEINRGIVGTGRDLTLPKINQLMQPQKDYSQNIIKARVAETIIQELFIQNRYNVFNYCMERSMPILIGKIYHDKSEVSTAIRSMPIRCQGTI